MPYIVEKTILLVNKVWSCKIVPLLISPQWPMKGTDTPFPHGGTNHNKMSFESTKQWFIDQIIRHLLTKSPTNCSLQTGFTFGSTCELSTVSSLSTMSNSVVCVPSIGINTFPHSGCQGPDQALNVMHRHSHTAICSSWARVVLELTCL
jgi:hypothetical protein